MVQESFTNRYFLLSGDPETSEEESAKLMHQLLAISINEIISMKNVVPSESLDYVLIAKKIRFETLILWWPDVCPNDTFAHTDYDSATVHDEGKTLFPKRSWISICINFFIVCNILDFCDWQFSVIIVGLHIMFENQLVLHSLQKVPSEVVQTCFILFMYINIIIFG